MNAGTEIIPVCAGSDGDPSHSPPEGWRPVLPPHLYLNKLADQWMQANGHARPGIKYYLDRLPDGYRLYERARPGDPKIVDKHLYGHPSKKRFFTSPNHFYPHFEHLMNNGSNRGCPCTVCNLRQTSGTPSVSIKKKTPKLAVNASNERVSAAPRPSFQAWRMQQDTEETPDTIRYLLNKLRQGPRDEEIVEHFSLDWHASKKALNKWIDSVMTQPSWLPRQGEIVLFVRDLDDTIDFDNVLDRFRMFSESEGRFVGSPLWEAGIVGQCPSEPVTIDELVAGVKEKKANIAYSGFRIEPIDDPNTKDSYLSKRYKYVPLRSIRPFSFWQIYLKGIPEDGWHPTIHNAIKISSSIALVGKNRFRGSWPEATIFCSGIYVGAEFICPKDTVRVQSEEQYTNAVTEFLEVRSIKLRLTNLDRASDDDYDDGHPYNSAVLLSGKAFTSDFSKAWRGMRYNDGQPMPRAMEAYAEKPLYWLHDPILSYQVPFSRILGRAFESNAMLMWFPSSAETATTNPLALLSYGAKGIRKGRRIASKSDTRIMPGKTWFWADTRLEAVGAATLNGVHASTHDEMREFRLEEWRDNAKSFRRAMAGDTEAATEPPPRRSDVKITPTKRLGVGKSNMAAAARTVALAADEDEPEESDAAVKSETEPAIIDMTDYDLNDIDMIAPGSHAESGESATRISRSRSRKRSRSATLEFDDADAAGRHAAPHGGISSSSSSDVLNSEAALLEAFKKQPHPQTQIQREPRVVINLVE